MTNTDKLLSRNEAAEFLGVKPQTLNVWKATGRYDLPVVMIGRLPKYKLSDLENFIDQNTINCGGSDV